MGTGDWGRGMQIILLAAACIACFKCSSGGGLQCIILLPNAAISRGKIIY